MSFKIHIESSDHEFTAEADESVLAAALRHGLHLPYNCRNGTCGTCKGRLVAGTVEYSGERPEALSEQEQGEGLALFCQAHARSDLRIEVREVRSVTDIPIKTLPCRVAKKELLAPDVLRLYLKLPNDERLQYFAGQYIDFLLKDGRRRAFSIANAPHRDALIELHVRHVEGGSFTDYLFDQLQEKAILRLQGPFGNFYLREDSDRPIILMAGGTGFAPIKGLLEHAFAEEIKRPMHLYWGARGRSDLYLDELAQRWMAMHDTFRYTPVLSQPHPEDRWDGRMGLVHEAIARDYPDLANYEVYACGPPVMVEAGRLTFAAQGLPLERYFSDAFEYAKDSVPAAKGN